MTEQRARVGVTKGEIDLWLRKLGLVLSEAQAAPVYDTDSSLVLVAGGVGAGKSFTAALFGTVRLPYSPLIWIIGPDYKQTEEEFKEFTRFLSQMDLIESVSDPVRGGKLMKTKLGGVIETRTSNDLKKVAARGPTGIILTEPAQQVVEVLYRAIERTSRSEHPEFQPWVMLAGTFEESSPWFDELWELLQGDNTFNGKSYSVATWDNRWRYPQGEADADLVAVRATMPKDRYEARYGAHPVKPVGLVLPEFSIKDHVSKDIRYDPNLPCEIWIDPGWSFSHYAVEVVQFGHAPRVRVIDEIYVQYAKHSEIIGTGRTKLWWNRLTGGVIDIAAKQHHSAISAVEVWRDAGVNLRTKYIRLEDGIDRHRSFLIDDPQTGIPNIMFNPKCQGAIVEYRNWKRRKESSTGLFRSEPESEHCDALKAISYGLIDHFGLVSAKRRAPERRGKVWR